MRKHPNLGIKNLWLPLVNLAALTLFFTPVIESAAYFGLLTVTWNPMCKLSEELHDIAGSATHKAVEAAQEAKKLTLAAKRFGIFAAKDPESEKAAAARILRLHFEVKAAAAAEHLAETLIPSNFKAAAHTSYLKGRLDETIKTLEGITSASNNGCLVTGATAATTRAGEMLVNEKCRLEPPDLGAREHYTKELSATGYTNLKKGTTDDSAQASATRNCKLLTGDDGNGVGTTEDTAAFTLADGYISVPATDTAVSLTDLTQASTISAANNKAWAAAHSAVQGILNKDDAAYKNTTDDLKAYTTFSEMLSRILLKTAKPNEDTVSPHRTNLFGEPTNKEVDDLSKLVDETEIPKGVGGLNKATQLKDISNIKQLNAILGYYEVEEAKELNNLKQKLDAVEKKKQKNSPQKKQKECAKHKDNKKACTGANCIWKEGEREKGECKPKVGEGAVKEENDEKTTNTTGNNSVVINKVSLLLAVLLLS
uniref:Variant surface glycoprotein n=1 Tax=Trypanosoma brucei TaxID=5691 RepID=A0A1V0FZ65_9TRYP|nr:variant surface glycoprotein [Trypanosoma brucei]